MRKPAPIGRRALLRRSAVAFALILAPALLSACGGGDLLTEENLQADELTRNRRLWEDADIESYRFTAQHSSAEGFVTYEAEVRNGQVIAAEAHDSDDNALDATSLTEDYGTIEDQFDTVEETLGEDDLSVTVEYDVATGRPAQITSTSEDEDVVDAGSYFRVTTFEALD